MTYEELVAKAREVFGKASADSIEGHVAYQFNITGEGEGAFYLEIGEGQIHIEPYEYYDRDVLFTTTADALIQIGLGELEPMWAVTTGKLKVEGSIEKALLLKKLCASIEENQKAEASACGSSEEKEASREETPAVSAEAEQPEATEATEAEATESEAAEATAAEATAAEAEAAEATESEAAEATAAEVTAAEAEKEEQHPAGTSGEEKKDASVPKAGNGKKWPNRKKKKRR